MKAQTPKKKLREEAEKLHASNDILGALRVLDQIIDRDLADLEDWCLTGELLAKVGEFAEAIGAYERCLDLKSDHVQGRFEYGRSLYNLGHVDKAAEEIYRLAESTNLPHLWQSLATIAPGVPQFSLQRVYEIRQRYASFIRSECELREGFRRASASISQPIRVAYISAHWSQANYMKPVWPLINAHDCNRFDFFVLDDSSSEPAWSWLKNRRVERCMVGSLSNSELAKRIQEMKIDILVDLSSYSKPLRLGLFVHRAAPIQMAWFNAFATNGFNEIDFIVGDRTVMGSGEEQFYAERFLELPVSYLTFQTEHDAPAVAAAPVKTSGQFTFGCLATQYKITPQVIAAWSEILKNSRGTKLVLANRALKSSCNREFILNSFKLHGIDVQRIQIFPPASHFEFLKYYDRIDVALDVFPYNGGTTTMEAIWQGVPVLTFNGDRWASRTSRTILEFAGLDRFVANDREEYIETATELATDQSAWNELAELRREMRERLLQSSVTDSTALARGMEDIFQKVVQSDVCSHP